ncbi:unnamed protein product [Mytilus coruscus]|uniref:Integrase catalytic domain-containing protein n=1 Tax=Mytilus coruscus TaxID=42192 RepID=A0A6J8D8D0_MYTCO|nr:unnamed protein product [Mytilus coruscus]
MAILQQFNFDLQYKPAEQMQVADALSRCTRQNDEPVISPDEDDPFFPYVTERTGQIKLPSGRNLADFLHNSETESATVINVNNVNNIDIFSECVYDADTDDVETTAYKKETKQQNDQGSEFISKGTKELCKMLEVSQEFTPSFKHHCLGICERSHRTLEERMTPYIRKGRPWNNILPAVIFSMNSCTNAATQ